MQKQKTLAKSFSMQGKGLHTGLDIQITFNPAPENHGYKIKRVDLEGQPVIDALAENVASTQRGTVLSKNGIQISTFTLNFSSGRMISEEPVSSSFTSILCFTM